MMQWKVIKYISTYGNPILSENPLKPKIVEPGSPVFSEPWQAQVMAMADLLIESGQLPASQWSSILGAHLKVKQFDEDSLENYYLSALAALTELIERHDLISSDQLENREQDWKKAYLATPHGQPVELEKQGADHNF